MSPSPAASGALCILLLFALSCGPGPGLEAAAAQAGLQVDLRGSIGGSVHHHWSGDAPSGTVGIVDGRLEVSVELNRRWRAAFTFEPRLQAGFTAGDEAVSGSAGFTEGYIAYRTGAADLLAGRLLMPLETARLAAPYSLTPPDAAGRREGLFGARADVYVGSSRLQAGALQLGDRWTAAVSLRRAFAGWEATGHLVAQEQGPVAGLGFSSLVGQVVAYGEVWSVPGETALRFGAGARGFLGALLWTAEIARAPWSPGAEPVPQAGFQLAYAPFPWLGLALDGSVAHFHGSPGDPPSAPAQVPAHRWGLGAVYEVVPGVSELEFSFGRLAPPFVAASHTAGLGFRYYF